MKGLSIKKLAAIATGAALVGTALAPIASAQITNDDIYNASGTPKVDVVVGAAAQVSDAVWAGNIAAAIAEHATKATSVTASGEPGVGSCGECTVSNKSVDLVVGGTVTYGAGSKQFKVYMDAGGNKEVDANVLTDAQLPHLYNESVTYKRDGTSYTETFQEKIGVSVQAKFDSGSSIKDLIAKIDDSEFYYLIDVNSGGGIDLGSTSFTDTGSDDIIKIPFFGSLYQLNTATLTGTKNLKLVKTAAKESYNEGETITGLKGRGSLEGQDVTVKVATIIQSGPTATYQVSLELYDEDGTLVNSQSSISTGTNMADEFVDADDEYVLESNLFVDTIAVGTTTGVGYIEVTKGTDTVLLYDTKGYPYDATNTTGPYDYKVSLTTDNNSLQQIKIYNSREKWTDASIDNGPIYPTNAGDSLTGQTGEQAVFGQALDDGTAGKSYASVEFQGFESTQDITAVKVGRHPDILDALDGTAFGGGIYFRDTDDQPHNIPMALRLTKATSEGGQTFNFDTKTIWYQVFPAVDVNFQVNSSDYLNNRQVTVACAPGTGTDVNVTYGGNMYACAAAAAADINCLNTDLNIDGISYHITGCNGTTGMDVKLDNGGYIVMRKDTNSGGLILNTSGDSTDFSYGKIFYHDDNVFEGSAAGSAVEIESTSDEKFSYALRVTTESNADSKKMWLVLRADDHLGSSSTIQNSHDVAFKGTMEPNSTTETDISSTGWNRNYFLPKSRDWNSNSLFENSQAYFYSWFNVDPRNSGDTNFNVYIDNADGGLIGTFPNAQLSYPSQDVYFDNAGSNTWNLKSGSESAYLKAAWTKSGDKVELDEDNDTAVFSMPEAAEKIIIYVHGTEVSRETTGESITVAEGETGTTSEGTTITIETVNYDASCEAGEAGEGTCGCIPSSCTEAVSIAGPLVLLDTQAGPGSHIIVGGHIVNQLAAAVSGLADQLTAPGDVVVDVFDGDIVVAGYTASDTGDAAQELIDCIEADFVGC